MKSYVRDMRRINMAAPEKPRQRRIAARGIMIEADEEVLRRFFMLIQLVSAYHPPGRQELIATVIPLETTSFRS